MSNEPEELPIWLRPEPGDRKPRFTREKIAAAALAIADEEGFDAVSMRRIAARLNAGTMTLYHYVRTKDDLVALMDDALMGEILVPDGELPSSWREAMTLIARRTRDIFVRHPWALLSMQGAMPGPNAARHFEQCLAALARTPFDRKEKLELLTLVDDFVFGHTLRAGEQRNRQPPSPAVVSALMEYGKAQLASGAFPHTAALFDQTEPADAAALAAGVEDEEARFDRGLAMLLDGAAAKERLKTP